MGESAEWGLGPGQERSPDELLDAIDRGSDQGGRIGRASPISQEQNFENFSKCFSRLEGLPASESRAEPRKSLSEPRDWTFHSRTSRQK